MHDYAEFETAARAEGIPKPTLHWIKDDKQLNLDDANITAGFNSASDTQVSTQLALKHFNKEYEGNVSKAIMFHLHYAHLSKHILMLPEMFFFVNGCFGAATSSMLL